MSTASGRQLCAAVLALVGALALACGSSSSGGAAKLGLGAACTCAGDDAAAGTDTLCAGAPYTTCDSSLSLYCVDGVCANLCDAGKCPSGYACQDLPHSNQTYCALAGGDGGDGSTAGCDHYGVHYDEGQAYCCGSDDLPAAEGNTCICSNGQILADTIACGFDAGPVNDAPGPESSTAG